MIASSRLQTLLITGYIIVSALTRPRHYNVRQFIAKAENIINELLERRTRLSSKSALKSLQIGSTAFTRLRVFVVSTCALSVETAYRQSSNHLACDNALKVRSGGLQVRQL
jgi:hypothetical protein